MSSLKLVHRPWGLCALFAALVLAGLLAWPGLPVDLLPRLPHPSLTVITNYQNASPREVEDLITRRLESVLGTVSGLIRMESSSTEGRGTLRLYFQWGRELAPAAAEVREKLDSVADQLPQDAEPPLVLHYDPSQLPVVTLALGKGSDLLAGRVLAQRRIKTKLEALEGVAAVRLSGGLTPEVQVLADRARLVALGVDLAALIKAIEEANLNSPAGEITFKGGEVPVRTVGRFSRPAQIEMVPIREEAGGSVVRVGDLARAVATHKDRTGFCRVDGQSAVLISVLKEPEANAVKVSRRVRDALPGLQKDLPKPWALWVADDLAPFVSDSLSNLGQMVVLGGVLSFLVLLGYLRRPAQAALVVLSAPVALIATFGFMRLFGVGLNLMSIGGLALGVGMLVDGSIVMLEAYQRHRDSGVAPEWASVAALGEVRGPLIVGGLTTAAVLSPLLFLTGLAQRLFVDFAFTLVVSLGVSLCVALLLLPALLLWRSGSAQAGDRRGIELIGRLGPLLDWGLAHRRLVILICGAMTLAAVAVMGARGFSLLPQLDAGRAVVLISLPPDSGVDKLEQAVIQAEKKIRAVAGVERVITRAGTDPEDAVEFGGGETRANQALITVHGPRGAKFIAKLRAALAKLDLGRARVAPSSGLGAMGGGGFSPPVLAVLTGEDEAKLRHMAEAITAELAKDPRLSAVELQGALRARQLNVKVDRQAAALFGITVSKVAGSVSQAVQGETAGKLLSGDRQIDIRVRLAAADRQTPRDLGLLPVATPGGQVLLLNQLANLKQSRDPIELLRRERRPAMVIRGQVTGGPFSRVQDTVLALAQKRTQGSQIQVMPGPARDEMDQALSKLGLALFVALMLIYVILVLRFESLRWPLVIALGLPPIALGPALALLLGGIEQSALALLGAVVLMGVAVNGSILLLEMAIRLNADGMAPAKAALKAARIRLAPLSLSVATTVLGVLPLCLSWGGGAAISRPLAITVAAGLVVGVFTTLVLTPVLFVLFAPRGPDGDQA